MIDNLKLEDIDEALSLSEIAHKDSAWQDFPFSADVLRARLEKRIESKTAFNCVYKQEGKIVGYFLASVGYFMFSSRPLGMENGIYVLPEYRGGRVFYSMAKAYNDWCRVMGAVPLVEIYFNNDEENEKVYSIMRKLGLTECGRAFRG